jgi:hypothetical protein
VSPGALAGGAEVEREDEFEDDGDLAAYEDDRRVWKLRGMVLVAECEEGICVNEQVRGLNGNLYPKKVSSARPLIHGDLDMCGYYYLSMMTMNRTETYRERKTWTIFF